MRSLLLLLLVLLPCGAAMLHAQDDPMDQEALEITPSAVLDGQLLLDSLKRYDSINGGGGVTCLKNYGATFQILGYRGDSVWWATSVERCDTFLSPGRPRSWVLVYRHRIGVVPKVTDCQIIGRDWPLSTGSELLTGGNYDGDSFPDVVIRVKVYDSTNPNLEYTSARVAVLWGGANGYSQQDSSLVSIGGYQVARSVRGALTTDLNNDGTDDLLLDVYRALNNGVYVDIPKKNVYLGARNQRWGRGRAATADLAWWSAVDGWMMLVDQDCDGIKDVAIIRGPVVNILYRSPTEWFDTSAIETISITGSSTPVVFTDLTGDGVPELVCQHLGTQELRVYAGRAGQRLREQFGSGTDVGDPPDATHPVSRPWHRTLLPRRVSDDWTATSDGYLFTAFDANGNGTSDLLSSSDPLLCLYTADPITGADSGGYTGLDSYIDATLDTRYYGRPWGIWPSHGVWPRSNVVMGLQGAYASKVGLLWVLAPEPNLPVGGYIDGGLRRLPHPLGFRCQQAADVPGTTPQTYFCPGPDLSLSHALPSLVPDPALGTWHPVLPPSFHSSHPTDSPASGRWAILRDDPSWWSVRCDVRLFDTSRLP